MNTPDKKQWLSKLYPTHCLDLLSAQQIDELYAKSQPEYVSIKELEHKNINSYLINSEDGFVPAHSWRNKGTKPCITLKTADTKITVSQDHFFEMHNGKWKYAKYITPGEHVKTKNGVAKVIGLQPAGDCVVYDYHINHSNHRYYTNDISSHNSGAGKSLFLANLGVNWALAGLNVVYLTLELAEELVSMRMDAMFTGVATREIFRELDDIDIKVKMIARRAGAVQIKYMPSGKTANDIRAYLKELEVKTGQRTDVLLVDYLDLLMPLSRRVSPSDLYIKDKYVSEELRNLAVEQNLVLVTAAQLNRASVEEIEFDHSHISGGLSKIQTADNVFGIFTSRAMRERGRYQLQLMKTRSSSGVGQKIDLAYDLDTLKISSLPDDDESSSPPTTTSSIVEKLKRKTQTNDSVQEEPRIRAQTGSTKLREMLNSFGQDPE